MNELQIRLTGDISALQSALTKAKRSITEFEKQTESETNKSNVGFRRKIGLIEALTNKSKQLRVALSKATNENEIERYNQELEQTIKEMTRLNALGRQVGNTLGGANNGFNQATQSIGSANGVALEFNRIIQDAPFGIIGIGNNLQQLAGNFSAASKQAGGAGKAIAASFTALLSPANLALLAISAITAGFTAYQMGAFDGIFATKDFAKELEDFEASLKSLDRARLDAISNSDKEILTLNSLKGIIDSETTSREDKLNAVRKLQELYPAYFGNLSQEQILAGDLSKTYEQLTKTILAKAQAEASTSEFVKLAEEERLILLKTEEDRKRIEEFKQRALKNEIEGQTELQLIAENQARFLENKIKPELDRINEIEAEKGRLTKSVTDNLIEANTALEKQSIIIDDNVKAAEFYDQIWNDNIDSLERNQTELEKILDLYQQIVEAPKKPSIDEQIQSQLKGFDPTETGDEVPIGFSDEQLKAIQDRNKLIEDSFSALGIQIAASLNISDNALKGFVTNLLSATPKIIQAIIQTAQANKAASDTTVESAKKGALANGIFLSTEGAKGLGPIGLALLPVLIGGALALISGAFSKIGAGGGGGGSVSGGASATPTIFTNQNTVSPPTPNSPSNTPFDANIDNSQGRLVPMFKWDGFYLEYQNYNERRSNG